MGKRRGAKSLNFRQQKDEEDDWLTSGGRIETKIVCKEIEKVTCQIAKFF